MQQYEKFVTEHQEYSDCYNSCVEWLNSVREKLSACSDVSGDRHAIQSRLDKIQVSFSPKLAQQHLWEAGRGAGLVYLYLNDESVCKNPHPTPAFFFFCTPGIAVALKKKNNLF